MLDRSSHRRGKKTLLHRSTYANHHSIAPPKRAGAWRPSPSWGPASFAVLGPVAVGGNGPDGRRRQHMTVFSPPLLPRPIAASAGYISPKWPSRCNAVWGTRWRCSSHPFGLDERRKPGAGGFHAARTPPPDDGRPRAINEMASPASSRGGRRRPGPAQLACAGASLSRHTTGVSLLPKRGAIVRPVEAYSRATGAGPSWCRDPFTACCQVKDNSFARTHKR